MKRVPAIVLMALAAGVLVPQRAGATFYRLRDQSGVPLWTGGPRAD